MSRICVDTSYDPNSWKAPDATDVVSLEEGMQYYPTKDVGGICCDCRQDRVWGTTELSDGVFTLICHICKTDHTAIIAERDDYVRNQILVGDDRWYFVEKK